MDIIGNIVLLTVFMVSGILLYFPLRWLVKRKIRDTPSEDIYKLRFTSAGLACIVLMIGYSQETFSPETEFGRFISTIPGSWVASLNPTGMLL